MRGLEERAGVENERYFGRTCLATGCTSAARMTQGSFWQRRLYRSDSRLVIKQSENGWSKFQACKELDIGSFRR